VIGVIPLVKNSIRKDRWNYVWNDSINKKKRREEKRREKLRYLSVQNTI